MSLFLDTTPSQSMENNEDIAEYKNYWETVRFWNEDLNYSWATDQQSHFGYCDWSSSNETASTIVPRNVDLERNRRKSFSDKLLALREAVPKISRLDKASVIKDAIEYIEDLQEQEKRLQAEIMELESERLKENPGYDFEQEQPVLLRSNEPKYDQTYDHMMARSCPIQVHEFSVTSMGEKSLYVSLTCSKTKDTMIKICQVFESLKLKIITAHVTTVSDMVKKTVLVKADVEEKDHLKNKIERAISSLQGP